MNDYDYYKAARDAAWRTLIECQITELPVDLTKIAKYYNIPILLYSKGNFNKIFKKETLEGDGFISKLSLDLPEKLIFINDKKGTYERRRFTLGHEIGHGVLGHDLSVIHYRHDENDSQHNIQETQANIFARDLLMPATVIAALDIHSTEDIMELCQISYQSAHIRAERMKVLYERNMFNKHPLERQVRHQFDEFIINYKK